MTRTQNTNQWLARLDRIISERISEVELDNKGLADDMGISERQLFRKVKALTGKSPQKYLRQNRLEQARQYLKQGEYRTVKEAAFAVGYVNASYFTRQFEQEFGAQPYQVLKAAGWR